MEINVIEGSCLLSAPLQLNPAEAAWGSQLMAMVAAFICKVQDWGESKPNSCLVFCQQWQDTNEKGFISSGWNPKVWGLSQAIEVVAVPGWWCSLGLMGSFTWRSGNQSLIEPHLFIQIFATCHTRSDSVEGLLIFRQCHRPTEQWFLRSSLNESITFEMLNFTTRQ